MSKVRLSIDTADDNLARILYLDDLTLKKYSRNMSQEEEIYAHKNIVHLSIAFYNAFLLVKNRSVHVNCKSSLEDSPLIEEIV